MDISNDLANAMGKLHIKLKKKKKYIVNLLLQSVNKLRKEFRVITALYRVLGALLFCLTHDIFRLVSSYRDSALYPMVNALAPQTVR